VIGGWIADILDDIEDEARIATVREQVVELCRKFPVYQSLDQDRGAPPA
jgi:glycine hydroxymethyltransferase